ncbi:MAG TPA: hypothetical protein VGQ37_09010 [Vicinamibacterales bacterium]|jgi:hypothetical protein|nr:hypothetical protein [Vicinamibacterales bacterium]
MRLLSAYLATLVLTMAAACADAPTAPSNASGITFGQPSPATGSTIVISGGAPGGFFINKGSGQLSVPVTLRSTREVPWAILYVYPRARP